MQTSMKALRARMEYLLTCPEMKGQESDTALAHEIPHGQSVPWALQEWRMTAIPEWRIKLHKSIEEQDQRSEQEARWMLGEILEDIDYLRGDV